MLTDMQNSFTERLRSKFLAKRQQNILPHLKRVATLPCEMLMTEKQQQPEKCIMIDDIAQYSRPYSNVIYVL